MAKSKLESLESGPMFIMKSSMQVSGSTVQRYRTPTNQRVADAMTQYVFDHKRQAQVIPDRRGNVLVEATNISSSNQSSKKYQSLSRDNRTAALGALAKSDIGGSPDESGYQAKYFGSK